MDFSDRRGTCQSRSAPKQEMAAVARSVPRNDVGGESSVIDSGLRRQGCTRLG